MIYEQQLVIELSQYLDPDYEQINKLVAMPLDWNLVLGMLHFHRIPGIAFKVLNSDYIDQSKLYRPIMFSLGMCHDSFFARITSMNEYIVEINKYLTEKSVGFAFLKGTILSNSIYPWGCRASCDVDILIRADDIDRFSTIMDELGYIQGEYDYSQRTIKKLSRKELIHRRMNWGEIAEFHKVIQKPCADKITVDVNFSLDWHPYRTECIVDEFLKTTQTYTSVYNGATLYSLEPELFLLHLFIHAYKELTLYSMVQRMQDIELYKFIDIYTFLSVDNIDWGKFTTLVRRYNYVDECFTILYLLKEIFPRLNQNTIMSRLISEYNSPAIRFTNRVYDPTKSQTYEWRNEVMDRLFDTKRLSSLWPINPEK